MNSPTTAKTPAEELRAAAAKLRTVPTDPAHVIHQLGEATVRIGNKPIGGCLDCGVEPGIDIPELAELIAVLLNAREPLAAWLDKATEHVERLHTAYPRLPVQPDAHALAVARAILGASS